MQTQGLDDRLNALTFPVYLVCYGPERYSPMEHSSYFDMALCKNAGETKSFIETVRRKYAGRDDQLEVTAVFKDERGELTEEIL